MLGAHHAPLRGSANARAAKLAHARPSLCSAIGGEHTRVAKAAAAFERGRVRMPSLAGDRWAGRCHWPVHPQHLRPDGARVLWR